MTKHCCRAAHRQSAAEASGPSSPLTGDGWFDRVVSQVVAESAHPMSLPHVVYVDDPYLGHPSVFGPFADPVVAARFAERYVGDLLYGRYRQPVTAIVVALEPVGDAESL